MAPCDADADNQTADVGYGTHTSFCPGAVADSVYELLQFRGASGVHCPWLNIDGSAAVFMETLTSFVSRF